MKRSLLFLSGLLTLLLIAPLPAYAAQAARSLARGRVFTFENNDTRTVAYVSVSGNNQYDYVVWDENGVVTDFGISAGRFPVRGGGRTAIVPHNTVSAAFDGASVSVSEAEGTVLTRVTAAAGETLIIASGSDDIMNIAMDNTGLPTHARYDFAVYDQDGAADFFDADCPYTTLAIPLRGKAVLTALENELTVMFPTVFNENGLTASGHGQPALYEASLQYGQTYTVTNAGSVPASVVIPGENPVAFDTVMLDDEGITTAYQHEAKLSELSVEGKNTYYLAPIKANSQNTLDTVPLLIPGEQQADLTILENTQNTLQSYTAGVGQTLSFTNNGKMPFTFRADAEALPSVLDYTYGGGINGETQSFANVTFEEMTIDVGFTWAFTVKSGAPLELWLPASWLSGGLRLNSGTVRAVNEHTLAEGQTLRIENTDPAMSYAIKIQPIQHLTEFEYDYMIEDNRETQYKTEVQEAELILPPSGVMAVTARKPGLTVLLPAPEAVTAQETDEPAAAVYSIAPGASLWLTNNAGDRSFPLLPQRAGAVSGTVNPVLDYITRDGEGLVIDFGHVETGAEFLLETGRDVLFTNSDTIEAEIILPQSWLEAGLTAAASELKALHKVVLQENDSLDIINQDGQYHQRIKIESSRDLPNEFDFVSWGEKETVADYGIGAEGYMDLLGGGKLTVMPVKDSAITVCYPMDLNETTITTAAASAAPLYRRTIKPGERIVFNNRTKLAYTIQNSSEIGTGRYYTHEGTGMFRVSAEDLPLEGVIELAEKSSLSVLAATGADLEIWIPREWAPLLIRP